MSVEIPTCVNDLVPYANPNCAQCYELRGFTNEVLELAEQNKTEPAALIARFAGFASMCARMEIFPAAGSIPGPCSVDGRECKLAELLEMEPEERSAKIVEIAAV